MACVAHLEFLPSTTSATARTARNRSYSLSAGNGIQRSRVERHPELIARHLSAVFVAGSVSSGSRRARGCATLLQLMLPLDPFHEMRGRRVGHDQGP